MTLKRWLMLAFIACVIFGAIVSAQDDDEEEEERPPGEAAEGKTIEDVSSGVDAEDAADEIEEEMDAKDEVDTIGLKAFHYFPKYADLKVPAGERVEILVPITNAAGNPTYEVALVAGHFATLDHSRYIQNFSAQVYDRKVEEGETATVKYSVTPDPMIEPMEYAFVVAAYLRTDDNNTLMVTAFNGTMVVTEPLGFDFKGFFTMAVFGGGIAYAVYYYISKKAVAPRASRPASSSPAAAVETGTKSTAYDPDFVDPEHLKFIEKMTRKRSSSPKK